MLGWILFTQGKGDMPPPKKSVYKSNAGLFWPQILFTSTNKNTAQSARCFCVICYNFSIFGVESNYAWDATMIVILSFPPQFRAD